MEADLRELRIVLPKRWSGDVERVLQTHDPLHWSRRAAEDEVEFTVLVGKQGRQELIDALQAVLAPAGDDWRLVILPVEASLPLARREGEAEADEAGGKADSDYGSREELYDDVVSGLGIGRDFLIFTALSAVVAAVGLMEDNVAVVIGAMVIAPLLSTQLALSLGAVLGDRHLIARAARNGVAGLLIALGIGAVVGAVFPDRVESTELMLRTRVGWSSVILALASGAAAALSLLSGAKASLVGVMVAAALLPPAVTAGVMAGAGRFGEAAAALMLFAVNVVALNISGQLMLLWRGVKPRTWLERRAAEQSVRWSLAVWGAMLAVLAAALAFGPRIG